MPRSPEGASWKNTTSSNSSPSSANTPIEAKRSIGLRAFPSPEGALDPAPIMTAEPMFPCAYLRVFQPLEAFPAEERGHWERYIVAGGHSRPSRPVYRERPTVPEGRLGLLSPADGDHADVRLEEGTYFVCPWRTKIRLLASLLSLRESTPPDMVEALVSEAEARRAARELARMRRRGSAAVPFILQSPWHVPIRWFLLFTDEERRVVE